MRAHSSRPIDAADGPDGADGARVRAARPEHDWDGLVASQARTAAALVVLAATATVALIGLRVWHTRTPDRYDAQALRLVARLPGATGPTGRMLAVRVVDAVTPAAVVTATIALVVLAWVLLRRPPITLGARLRVVGFCLAAPVASRGAEAALKQLVDRRPPRWGQLPVSMLTQHPNPMLAFSYPSGHVAIITTLALVGMLVLRAGRVRPQLVGAAVVGAAGTIGVVAVSLVVLRFHFVSDVVGGAALGVAVTLTAALVASVRPPWPWPRHGDRGGDRPIATTRPRPPAAPGTSRKARRSPR